MYMSWENEYPFLADKLLKISLSSFKVSYIYYCDNVTDTVQHVGSTSMPDWANKPH